MGCDSTYKYLLQSKPEQEHMAEAQGRLDLCPCDCKLVRGLNGQSGVSRIEAGMVLDHAGSSARKYYPELFNER